MNFIQTVLAFLLALGPLIIFHELGHYTAARLCGVKVLRFSLGMGKVVWSRRFGKDQTEWAVSVLPLGGYVKMLDSRDEQAPAIGAADLQREFTRQSVWRRIAIVAAGPLANFVLAILVFAGLYMHGLEDAGTRLRAMAPATAAYEAGLRPGDRIVAVDGTPVESWSDLRWEIMHAVVDQREARLEVRRPSGGSFGAVLPAGAMSGLDLESDVLTRLGMGAWLPKPVLEEVVPGGAGARAGLRAGDLITAIDGKPIPDGMALVDAIRPSGGRSLSVTGVRDGEEFTLAVTPELDPSGKVGVLKVRPAMGREAVTVAYGPLDALARAVRKTWELGAFQLKFIGKMITGQASWKNVTGPITIADYAGQTARLGAIVFLTFVASISISLGVMNLLPIPVLDGGLLLYYSLEVLTGRPLPERIGEFAQRAGLGLLVMLMALAVFNDVVRLL
jgi:regulator of sigma E protease